MRHAPKRLRLTMESAGGPPRSSELIHSGAGASLASQPRRRHGKQTDCLWTTANATRRGAILVWFALSLTLLLGLTGLVVDGGYLMATHRHLQNSVDAAAMAAADELLRYGSHSNAGDAALESVQSFNQLPTASVTVNVPPAAGPHAGQSDYVEVVAELEVSTLFIHLLPGTSDKQLVRARAVGGVELVPSSYAILALDPDARPGLSVTGNAQLAVRQGIAVNSEGGGVDHEGVPVGPAAEGYGAYVARFASVQASEVRVAGGVNRPEGFESYVPGESDPLRAGQQAIADPLVRLPIPSIVNGVVDVRRGAPLATSSDLLLNNEHDDSNSPNYIYVDQATGEQVMVLQPGIYSSISVTGGRVELMPGIFVLAFAPGPSYSLEITGGDVSAGGVMFYNTGEDYDPVTGHPDDSATMSQTTTLGRIRLDATLPFLALDTDAFTYAGVPSAISAFNGLLVYQRRDNNADIQLHGFGVDDSFRGSVYAPSASLWLPARGSFHSQFIVGSVRIPGHGNVAVQFDDDIAARAPLVFLVE